MIVGAIAGTTCWIFSYPQDTVKTMIQVSPEGTFKKNKYLFDGGCYDCIAKIYKKSGFKGFWIGITACLYRAVIANAIGIALYEEAQYLYTKTLL